MTALLFAVHPIHVEAVAWITSRKELMFTFFSLLSIIFYTDYTEKRKKVIYYFLVLFCTTLALLSKIQAVSLPFIFLLIDYLKGKSLKTRTLVGKVPFFLLCIFFGWLNINAQNIFGLITYGYHFSSPEKAFLLIYSVSGYFIKILFPYPLSVFYPFPFKPGGSIPLVSVLGPGLLIVGSAFFLFLNRKDKRPVIFGLLFFLINISIVVFISFNRDYVMADRYAYISSAGILFTIAVIADDHIRYHNKNHRAGTALFLICIAVLSLMTFQRNKLWKDPELLFRNALSSYNNSEIILNTLATQEIESGKYEDAIVHLNKAIMISPVYIQAFLNRGLAHGKTGDFIASVNDLSFAIKISPTYYEAWFARGNAYMKLNDLKQAYDDFTMVIHLNRYHFGALQNRAIVRGNMGDFAGAIEDLNAAISLNPGFAASYYLRGIALFNTGGNGCTDLNKAMLMGYQDALRAIEYYCK